MNTNILPNELIPIIADTCWNNCIIETYINFQFVSKTWNKIIHDIVLQKIRRIVGITGYMNFYAINWCVLMLFIEQKLFITLSINPPYSTAYIFRECGNVNNIMSLIPAKFVHQSLVIKIHTFIVEYLKNKSKSYELLLGALMMCDDSRCNKLKCNKYHENYFRNRKCATWNENLYCIEESVLYKKDYFLSLTWKYFDMARST